MLKKCLGIFLLAISTSAMADLSYSYVDGSWQRIEIDDVFVTGADVDGNILGIAGSFEVAEDWFARVAVSQADLDFGFDTDQLRLGIGYKRPISNNSDVFAAVDYVRVDASSSFGSGDDDGLGWTVGVRAMLTDTFELNGALGRIYLGDSSNNTVVSAGGLYNFTDEFAVGFSLAREPDVVRYGIVGRYYFGK